MVRIVTDSASNLPRDLASELGIEVAPLHVTVGQRSFRDGVDLVGKEFYEELIREGYGSTSAPSSGDFLEAFERSGAGEIACVTVAAAVSASNHQASLAAERHGGRVEVVDSLSASLGVGFVAIEAARAAGDGASLEEVAARAREVADRVRLVATIGTFEFLRRSGRVKKIQAYAATMLDIKPVFVFEHGDPQPLARPRTRGRALDRIVQEVTGLAGIRPVHLAAFHALSEEEAKDLVRRVEAEVDVVESFVVEASPVVGAHTGPGLVGLVFYPD